MADIGLLLLLGRTFMLQQGGKESVELPESDETITTVNDGISLIQKKNGLCFGTDALLLAAFIRTQKRANAVEFGSGTGIISLLCARREKFEKIRAIEIQPAYAALTARNAVRNGLSDRIETICADIRTLGGETADVVFSNPPYMQCGNGDESEDEGRQIARHEVHGDIAAFCRAAFSTLRYGGLFYLVYRPDRLTDLICALRAARLEPKRMRFVQQDEKHMPSLVLIEAKKGAAASVKLMPTLFLTENGSTGAEMRVILESGNMCDR